MKEPPTGESALSPDPRVPGPGLDAGDGERHGAHGRLHTGDRDLLPGAEREGGAPRNRLHTFLRGRIRNSTPTPAPLNGRMAANRTTSLFSSQSYSKKKDAWEEEVLQTSLSSQLPARPSGLDPLSPWGGDELPSGGLLEVTTATLHPSR